MCDGVRCCCHGDSAELIPYGLWPTVSKIGLVRPLARYAAPIPRMNAPGECETLLAAFGLSFPLGDVVMITFTSGRKACRTSQQRASSASYAAGAALVPSGLNCGRQ